MVAGELRGPVRPQQRECEAGRVTRRRPAEVTQRTLEGLRGGAVEPDHEVGVGAQAGHVVHATEHDVIVAERIGPAAQLGRRVGRVFDVSGPGVHRPRGVADGRREGFRGGGGGCGQRHWRTSLAGDIVRRSVAWPPPRFAQVLAALSEHRACETIRPPVRSIAALPKYLDFRRFGRVPPSRDEGRTLTDAITAEPTSRTTPTAADPMAAAGLVAFVAHARRVPSEPREVFADRAASLARIPARSSCGPVIASSCTWWTTRPGSRRPRCRPSPTASAASRAWPRPATCSRSRPGWTASSSARTRSSTSSGSASRTAGSRRPRRVPRTSGRAPPALPALHPVLERLFQGALHLGRETRSWREGQPRSLADVALDRIGDAIGPLRGTAHPRRRCRADGPADGARGGPSWRARPRREPERRPRRRPRARSERRGGGVRRGCRPAGGRCDRARDRRSLALVDRPPVPPSSTERSPSSTCRRRPRSIRRRASPLGARHTSVDDLALEPAGRGNRAKPPSASSGPSTMPSASSSGGPGRVPPSPRSAPSPTAPRPAAPRSWSGCSGAPTSPTPSVRSLSR